MMAVIFWTVVITAVSGSAAFLALVSLAWFAPKWAERIGDYLARAIDGMFVELDEHDGRRK